MATSNSRFMTNTIIIVVLVVVIGSVAVWRLSPKAESSQPTNTGNVAITGEKTVTINVETSGFSPSTISVPQGTKVTLQLVTNNTQGCIRSFVIPKFGIRKNLPSTGTTTVDFVAGEKGQIIFQCSMGMFRGTINVT